VQQKLNNSGSAFGMNHESLLVMPMEIIQVFWFARKQLGCWLRAEEFFLFDHDEPERTSADSLTQRWLAEAQHNELNFANSIRTVISVGYLSQELVRTETLLHIFPRKTFRSCLYWLLVEPSRPANLVTEYLR